MIIDMTMVVLWRRLQYNTCLPLLTIDTDTNMEEGGRGGGDRAIGENTLVDGTVTALSFIIKS